MSANQIFPRKNKEIVDGRWNSRDDEKNGQQTMLGKGKEKQTLNTEIRNECREVKEEWVNEKKKKKG